MDIQELIDFKYEEIEGLKLNLSEDHHMNPEQEDELEELIAQAIKFGELCAKRDAKAQAVPEGFVLVKTSDRDQEMLELIDQRDHMEGQAEELKDKLQLTHAGLYILKFFMVYLINLT